MFRRSSAMKVRRFLMWSVAALLTGLGTCNECSPSDNDSALHRDKTYTYRFRSEALAEAVGTTDDHSKIEIECEVRLAHQRECFYLLHLGDCAVTAAGGRPGDQIPWIDRQPLPGLAKYPVEFSLVKGEIKEVNAHDEDPLPYLNIKRGVLSAFVFKMSQMDSVLHESHTDIHGTCPMSSVPEGEEGRVKTSKDMLHCRFPSRPDWQFSPWSLFWNMSFIQHVINSTTDCVYKVDGEQRRVEHVACKERHAIMLESTHRTTTAVQTNVHYHLDLVKSEIQSSAAPSPVLSRQTGIEYEYDETPVPQSSPADFLTSAQKMLSDLVSDSRDEIRLFTVPQFTDLVAWLRTSHDLRTLLHSVRECAFLDGGLHCDNTVKDLANSYLSDALLQCNSLPCAKALTEMARSEELSPTYLDYLYYFWSFMHYSKPGFITNFVDMCKVKNSHQCWMSLGTFTYRTLSKTNNLDEKVLDEAKWVAGYYHDRIAEDCRSTDGAGQRPADCLVFMKAASNMGKYYGKMASVYSAGVRQLLEITTDEHEQTVVRTAALEALGESFDPDNPGERGAISNLLLPVFRNESLPPSVRLLSFHLLLDSSEDPSFVEHLLQVLREDAANPEVKYHVAETLNELLTDLQFGAKREKLMNYLREQLRENHLSLEWILHETKAKSRSSSQNIFLNLPFMPESMKRFGLQIKHSFLYDSPVLPAIFRENALFQMFGTFLPATKIGTYVEGFEAMLQLYEKNLKDMNGKAASLSQTVEALTKTLAEFGENVLPEGSLRNFDETVLSNVQKLRDLYWTHHKKLAPYAKSYFDLFGSTAKYMVYDGKQSPLGGDTLGRLLQSAMQSLGEGVTYNVTRVVRVIEAYHQVPTLMGLPLNWTTNATLAFALRAGFQYLPDEDSHAHAKGSLQPSAALTFLNRMVVDFPTVTQIGVQANSSAYTSTDFKAQFSSAKGKQTLRFDRPANTQKLLQLFRTNQLIKHDRYQDIPDWDIERVTSSWCTKDGVNSATGLRFCLAKSYPNVTHRIKPWALMAGSCNWEFVAHPTNQHAVHYGVELHEATKHKLKEFNAKFSVTEKESERAARFKALIDENGKDVSMELQTSLLPEFSATLSRNELTWRKNVSGHKIKGALALFKDFKYQFELTSEAKVQRGPTKTRSHTADDSQILVNEEKLTVDTPYSAYVWNKTVLRIGENVKADAYISYENLKGKSEWMKSILPPSLWESEQKASLKMLLHWKKPVHSEGDRVTRQTHFRLDMPRYVMTLRGDAFESETRSQVNVALARRDKNRGKLDAFLNVTSDWWTNEDKETFDKEVRVWNVTIPRRSWSLLYQKLHEGPKYHHQLALKRALMKPRDPQASKSDYVGWWSKEVSDRFTVEEKEVKLTADNEWLTLSNEELVAKYPTFTIQEVEGLRSGVLASDIVLRYPFRTATESLVFDGYFIYSTGPTTFRFQKDFDLTSSYNNLKLTSHSVYRTGSGGTELDHASHFTHLRSGSKAHNTIHFASRRPDKCRHLVFKHDIRSSDFDLSTDAVYRCEREDQELYTLRLNIDTNSSKWNMLDIKLDQIVDDLSSDYSREEMTTRHATGTLHVDAEWRKHPKHHQKRVVLCSKDGQCPNAELFLEFSGDGRSAVKFSLPNRNDTQITYQRKMSVDHKNLNIKMGYSDNQDGSSDFLELSGELIARNYHVWKGMVNANTFAKVRDLVTSGYKTFESAFAEIAKDEKHPLNEILRPALKVTLDEYWTDLKTQTRRFISTTWDEVYEIFYTVEAFAEPAYNVLVNAMTSVHEACSSAYHSVKNKSVTVWAIDYFEVPRYFHQRLTNLPHAVRELLNQLALGEGNILHFKFVTGKIVALTSFLEWPSVEFYPAQLKRLVSYETESRTRFDEWGSVGGHKIALVFGPLHVYTFDGRLYDVPAYPSGADCRYLLAHDVHGSLFSVLASETGLHVLFPEMSLTVDDKDEVFVNGSREPSALPLQASNGKVTVKRSDVVEIWSPSLSVICRSRDFLCILKMSESHAGGIIGLLGNADMHPSNDYKLPNGNVSSSLADFVRTYEVSGNPRCEGVVVRATPKPSEEEQRACLQELGDACAAEYQLREKFVEACASDVRDNNGACFAAAGLSALCHLQHTPTHTSCNALKPEGDEIGRSVEVVLVVQESKYLTSSDKSTTPAKGIESLVRALDHTFKEEGGYESVRYALLGFGGNGVHHAPTFHSANKDVWMPADSMIGDVLKTLEFKSREESDAVQALKYSLEELGHDTFHSKVFVVITSKDKQVADKPTLDYIQKRLDKNGLTLHVLSSYPSIEKGKKVFGVRADGLIFPSQSKEGEEYLDYPRGNLAKLASATRGSVFLSKFLRDNQPQAFFEEFAQEVWAKVKGEARKCRRCRLVPGGWWWYKQECAIVRC